MLCVISFGLQAAVPPKLNESLTPAAVHAASCNGLALSACLMVSGHFSHVQRRVRSLSVDPVASPRLLQASPFSGRSSPHAAFLDSEDQALCRCRLLVNKS